MPLPSDSHLSRYSMARRVLVVGSGAREHALAWKLAGERAVGELLFVPGNPGMARVGRCLEVDAADPTALADLAARERADLTVIGPEAPLERGDRKSVV